MTAAKAIAMSSKGITGSPIGACVPPCPGVKMVISSSFSSILAWRGAAAGAAER